MRHFEPARAEFDGEIDKGADLMQVGAMDDGIDRKRQTRAGHHAGESALPLPCAVIVAEPVIGRLVGALERQLGMVEAGVDQLAPEPFADSDA